MNKIESLTQEQEELLDKLSAEWISKALTKQPLIKEKIIEGIDFLYSLVALKPPQIIICSNPCDLIIAANENGANLKNNDTFDYLGIGYDSGWTAFYDYFQRIGIDLSDLDFNKWLIVLNSGMWASLLFENIAFVCGGPSNVCLNKDNNLHNEKGMAIQWEDGWGLYFLNGVAVERELVMTPAEKLDPKIMLTEKNAEIRREIVRKIGIERVCLKLGAVLLDKQGDYELLNLDIGDNRVRPYLKMKNPSIGTYHIEGVPPNIKTVEDALAWRNGTKLLPTILT